MGFPARPVASIAVALSALAVWCAPAWGGAVSFAPPAFYPSGASAYGMAVGDFDRDGNPDLAVVGSALSVLLGRPDGSFGAPTRYPVTGNGVSTGDFNADGDPDLAVASAHDNAVFVLLGGPGGTFGPPTAYPVGQHPLAVAVGDFNGDGRADLVVANSGSGSISVLLSRPDGTFGPHATYPAVASSLAVGDFDDDGHPDLAVGGAIDTISVLRGQPGGTFGPPTDYNLGQSGHQARGIVVGDFNHDGDPDLAAAVYDAPSRVAVLLGAAGSGFRVPVYYPSGGALQDTIAAADFNDDGNPDLALQDQYAVAVDVLLGDARGRFGSPTPFPGGADEDGEPVAAADVNRDGRPDLVAAGLYPMRVSVLLNRTIVFDPDPVALGPTVAGESSAAKTVALFNYANAGIAVSAVALAGADAAAFAIGHDGCSGTTVPSGGSCSVDVRFTPVRAGAHAARLEFTDDASGSPHSATLAGTGVSPAARSPSSIAFQARPDHTDSSRRTVTVTNVGSADLAVGGLAVAGADATSFLSSGDRCTGRTLATGQSCTVDIRFRPLGTGPKTAALQFSDSAVDSPQTVALSGTGTPGAWLEQSAQALKFGHLRVGSAAPAKAVTLTNVGSAAMTITSVAKDGANPADFRDLTQTCTTLPTLNPGDSCTASIAFRPTTTGTRTATLTIADTALHNPHHVALSGTGT